MDDVTARTNADALTERSLAQTKTRECPPRTDVGTIALHWATALAFVVSLVTGIRIAADALHAPFSKWLAPVLPQGEIFSWHFLAGLAVFFCGSADAARDHEGGAAEASSRRRCNRGGRRVRRRRARLGDARCPRRRAGERRAQAGRRHGRSRLVARTPRLHPHAAGCQSRRIGRIARGGARPARRAEDLFRLPLGGSHALPAPNSD